MPAVLAQNISGYNSNGSPIGQAVAQAQNAALDLRSEPYQSQTQGTIGTSGALPPGFSGNGNTAYTRAVQGNELSSEQLNNITSQNSPLMRNALAHGRDYAVSRGDPNSSMAAGAAQRAMIEAATPLAIADAGAYGTAAGQNSAALNQMATARMAAASAAASRAASMASAHDNAIIQANINRENNAFQGEQNSLNRAFNWANTGQQFQNAMTMNNTQFGQNMQNQAFQAAAGFANNSQAFRNTLALQSSQNPFLLQNPQALSGFMNFIDGGYGDGIDSMLNLALNGWGGG